VVPVDQKDELPALRPTCTRLNGYHRSKQWWCRNAEI